MQLLEQFFLSFGILSLAALSGGYLAARWRLPTVAGLLVVGMLLGPHGIGLIRDNDFIQMFSELGAALLLFTIGVEFSLSKMLGSGVRSILMASAVMLALFLTGYEIGVLLNLDYLSTLALAACLSFSSTAIFMRLLQQYGLIGQPQVPLLISVLVIEDLVAVAALAFFSSLGREASHAGHVPAMDILFSLLFSLALMGTVYLVVRAAFKRLQPVLTGMRSQDNLVLLALGLCVLMAFVASFIDLSPSIGAFLAGSILAGLPIREEMERVLSPFSLAFSSFFFLSIGLLVDPAAALADLPLVLLIGAAFMLTAFLSVTSAMFLSGFSFSQAVLAGIAMGTLGEFSLFIARQTDSLVPSIDLVSLISSSVLLTALAASVLLPRAPALASFLRARCAPSTRASLCQMRDYASSVMAEFEGRGMFLVRARSVFAALRRHMAIFALVGLLLFVLRRLQVTGALEVAGYSILLPVLALAVSLLMLLPALRDMWQELCLLSDALAEVLIRRHRQDERGGRQMARDFLILLGLLVIMVLHPIAVDVLLLPDFVHLGVLLPLGGMVLVVLHMFGILRRSFRSHAVAEGAS